MKTKNLFMVSVIAILAAGAARADIASTKYVDDKVSPVSAKADTNAGNITSLQTGKQDKITSTAKLNADLVDDSSSTNKFVTATEKATWSGKQDALGYTAENTTNKYTDIETLTDTQLGSTTLYPSMAVAQQMILNSKDQIGLDMAKKMDKTYSNDKNGVIVRNSAGTAMKGTGSDITVSDAGAITVNHATKATQDNSGNVITSTYATKTELTNLANGAVATNTADIATLKGTGAGSVSKAVADEDAAIKALIGGSYTSESTVHSAISANTSAISTLNGDASTAGSVAKAKAEAISAAAADATSKANAAQAAAEATAAADATSKANAAKSEAISAAATAAAGLYQTLGNKVTTVNAQSDDTHYPSAKAVYTAVSGASSSASAVDTKVGSLGDLSEGITNTSIVAAINDVASDAAADATTKANAAQAAAEATAAADATSKVNALANGAVATNTTDIATLKGTGAGSVSKAVSDAISAEVTRANAAYATAAQGTKADSAVQSVTTGTSNGTIKVDGTAVPVYGLGSAAYTASTDYAPSSMKMAVDVTPTTDGQYVLTAKVSNNSVTYSWESIGR